MRGRLALGVALLAALSACSSSEAKEAADASELGYRTAVERPAPTAEELAAALDEVLLEELSAEAGVEMQSQPVPCLDAPSRVRPGSDWVVDQSGAAQGITITRPPTWEAASDLGGWALGEGLSPSLVVLPVPVPRKSSEALVSHDLRLGSPAASLVEVGAVERLDQDTCFISGVGVEGTAVAMTLHLPPGRSGVLLTAIAFDSAQPDDITDMETALRLVEFGPS